MNMRLVARNLALPGGWVVLAGLLSGCGGAPAAPAPTVVDIAVATTKDVNADPGGAGAPIAIRIYQLGSSTGFKAATFFPVFEKDAATLKDDLVKREDLLLGPGQAKTLALTPEDRVHAIGVFAAYRDYEHVAWSGAVDVPAHQASKLMVTAGRAGLDLAITPVKPLAR